MKKLFSFFIFFALALGGIYAGIYFAAQPMANKFLYSKSGFNCGWSGWSFQPWAGKVGFDGLKVTNSDQFVERSFVDIGKIVVDCKPLTVTKKKPIFEEVNFQIDSITIVRNADGKINGMVLADAFSGEQKDQGKSKKAAPEEEQKAEEEIQFHIKDFTLKIGKIKVVDYKNSSNGEPWVKEYPFNYFDNQQDVESLDQILSPLIASVKKLGASLVFDVLTQSIKDLIPTEQLKQVMGKAGELGGQALEGAAGAGKSVLNEAKNVGTEAKEGVKGVFRSLTGQ